MPAEGDGAETSVIHWTGFGLIPAFYQQRVVIQHTLNRHSLEIQRARD